MEVKLLVSAIAIVSFMRVTLLFVVDFAAEAGTATSIGRIGSGCLAFRRAADINGLAPSPSSARTNCNEN